MLLFFWCTLLSISNTNACISDTDCSLLGNCIEGECVCSKGFIGPDCNYLNLSSSIDWDIDGYHPNISNQTSTWDGYPIKDNNNTYHLFISIIQNECNLTNYWITNSIIGHVISYNNPIGPYSLNDISLTPSPNKSDWDSLSVYNPSVIYDNKNDIYLLYYTGVKGNTVTQNCTINNFTEYKWINSNQRIGLVTSKSLYGPWKRIANNPIIKPYIINTSAWDSLFVTNSAPLLLSNGTIVIVYKARSQIDYGSNHEGLYITNDAINGPYIRKTNNPFNISTKCEDPYLFEMKYNNTFFTYHMLLHCDCFGLHTYSYDLIDWNNGNQQQWCNITLSNGTNIILQRRERPAIIFDENTQPKYLVTAVQPPQGRTFNMIQQLFDN